MDVADGKKEKARCEITNANSTGPGRTRVSGTGKPVGNLQQGKVRLQANTCREMPALKNRREKYHIML